MNQPVVSESTGLFVYSVLLPTKCGLAWQVVLKGRPDHCPVKGENEAERRVFKPITSVLRPFELRLQKGEGSTESGRRAADALKPNRSQGRVLRPLPNRPCGCVDLRGGQLSRPACQVCQVCHLSGCPKMGPGWFGGGGVLFGLSKQQERGTLETHTHISSRVIIIKSNLVLANKRKLNMSPPPSTHTNMSTRVILSSTWL